MKKPYRYGLLIMGLAFVLVFMTACGKDGNDTGKPPEDGEPTIELPRDPVTISMYNHFNNISDALAEKYLLEPIQAKLPHITFEIVKHGAGSTINELVAAQAFTDLYYGSNFGLPAYFNLELQKDMRDLVGMLNVNLDRFEPYALEAIEDFGDNGELFAIPFSANLAVLMYNKDIFDNFGVDYPTDGMTWDEVIDLGRRLTRTDGDTRYIGFEPAEPTRMGSAMSLNLIDLVNRKVEIDTPDWRRVLEVFQKAYSVPGYLGPDGQHAYHYNVFVQEGRIAMMPIWIQQILNYNDALIDMNWDMAQLPNFADYMGQGREGNITALASSVVSQNRIPAMEAIKLFISDEVQMLMSRNGTPSVLASQEIKDAYGADVPLLQGKNLEALFKTTPGQVHKITRFDGIVNTRIDGARKEIAEGRDLNSILRERQEDGDLTLQQELAK